IGVDLSKTMLEKARKNLPDCTFIQDDLSQLTHFNANSFHHVLAYGVLHYLSADSLGRFFARLKELCAPRARVVLCRVPDLAFHDEYQEYRRQKKFARSQKVEAESALKWTWISEQQLRDFTPD